MCLIIACGEMLGGLPAFEIAVQPTGFVVCFVCFCTLGEIRYISTGMTIALRMDGGIIRRPNVSDSSLAFSEHWYLVVLFPLALEAFPTLSHTLYTVSLRLLCALLSFLWIVMSLYILINIWCCISHCKKLAHYVLPINSWKPLQSNHSLHDCLITKPRGMFGLRKTILLLICVRSHSSDVLKNDYMITWLHHKKRSYNSSLFFLIFHETLLSGQHY